MPYHFPYTNLHDLDLDWLLNQVKSATDKVTELTAQINTSDANNIGTFKTVFSKLQEYSNILIDYMTYFNIPGQTPVFTYTTSTLTYQDETYTLISSVTTNPKGTTIGDYAQSIINQMVEDIQGAATQYAVRYNVQTLTGTQKLQALVNLGLGNIVKPYNMFDLSTGWLLALGGNGWIRRMGYANFANMVQNGELIPNSAELGAGAGGRAIACNYSMPYGTPQTPTDGTPQVYLDPGTYTVSCKVRIVDADSPIPSYFNLGGAIWFGSGDNKIPHAYKAATKIHLTANRNENSGRQHVTVNNIGFLKHTFTVDVGGRWCPVFYFQYSGAATSNIAVSEMQLEAGDTVTAYHTFDETFTVISANVPEGLDVLRDEVDTLKQNVWHDRYELPAVVSDFIMQKSNNSVGDSLLFFTDTHPDNDDEWNQHVYQDYGIMAKAKRSFPNDMIVNGGDWLLSETSDYHTQISKMNYVYGLGREMLGDDTVYLMGNHDANNNTSGSSLPTVPVGGFDAIFPGRTYYVLDKPNSAIKYAIWNTWTTGNAISTPWITAQIEYFARYLLEHSGLEYVFMTHIFVQSTKGIQHTEFEGDPAVYTPLVSARDGMTPYNTIMLEAAKIAKAYNTAGTYTFNGNTYNYNGNTGKVRYILAGHVHHEMYMIYDGVPVFMAGSFGLNAASGSNPRDAESYTNVINNIDGADSSHLFHVIGAMQYTVPSTSQNPVDVGKTILERDVVLTWSNGVPTFTLV